MFKVCTILSQHFSVKLWAGTENPPVSGQNKKKIFKLFFVTCNVLFLKLLFKVLFCNLLNIFKTSGEYLYTGKVNTHRLNLLFV